MSKVRVAMVTNIPAPYRVPIYERLGRDADLDFKAFFCAGSEPDRNWADRPQSYAHQFLAERFVTVAGRFIHFNPDVWRSLAQFRPDVVVTTGYNPSHLVAFMYAKWHGIGHVVMTDGTDTSEATLTALHRWVRRVVFKGSRAFVAASMGGFRLLQSYGVARDVIYQSHLCADNAAFDAWPQEPKQYDLLFCGRFVDVKNPFFALDVAKEVSRRLGRTVSLAFLGAGELEPRMREMAARVAGSVEARFLGFAQPDALPGHYKRSKVFLFPSSWDPWGVVANEACAAGVPIIVSPAAGAANEIVKNGVNGFVLPLVLSQWADAVERLLTDDVLYAAYSEAGKQIVRPYNFDEAAMGVKRAAQRASQKVMRR